MSANTAGPYLYQRSEPGLFTVGCFIHGRWEPESGHSDSGEAAARVHYLNGGADAALRAQRDELAAALADAAESIKALDEDYDQRGSYKRAVALLAKVQP